MTIGAFVAAQVDVNGRRYTVRSAGGGPALLLLHGFTGSSETWASFVPDLSRHWRVIAPDLPGHGGTPPPADVHTYRMDDCAHDIASLLDVLDVEQAIVVGYSMGGRLALHFAVRFPERVRTLVLESASPGIVDPNERRARREQDEKLARFIEERGMKAFVDRWEQLPLFATQARLPAPVRQRLRRRRLAQTAAGLAASLRTMGAGVTLPLQRELPAVDVPVLLLAGALDQKYCQIAKNAALSLPRGTVQIVEDAGHAVHLEQPDAWLELVMGFARQ